MTSIQAVLFDLDGTLLDTAPDLIDVLNQLRTEHHLPALPDAIIKPLISIGSKAMISIALNLDKDDSQLPLLRERFFALYHQNLAVKTRLFPNIDKVLIHLEQQQLPWGIVTNKLTKHTLPLLKALALRPGCVICGDTLSTAKPDPQPILHACTLLKKQPKDCLYIGDAITDVQASKSAGTKSLVALYGYINNNEDPSAWQADGYIREALEIITWL